MATSAGKAVISLKMERFFRSIRFSIECLNGAASSYVSGIDSLFSVFLHKDKADLPKGRSKGALSEYVDFCARTIAHLLHAVKEDVGAVRWTPDRKVENRIITVTYINAFLITLRKMIEGKKSLDPVTMKKSLAGISSFKFKDFHSSQYNRMAEEIYMKHFS